ncbi:hypothetical protein HDU96_007163 [Phlyctochytrium bullatum]|nr:hypothetical protein HDU96_007163 [Phlyctochytrium bullatum]
MPASSATPALLILLLLAGQTTTLVSAQFSTTVALFHANRACPAPRAPNPNPAPNRNAALAAVPSLGAGPGSMPPCQGDRLSEVRQGLRIPCMCPPSQAIFNEQFLLDHGAEIRTDGSVQSQQLNLEKAIVTLQNSFCCPAGAVTFNAQLNALRNGGGAPKAAPPPPPPAQQNNNPPPPPPPPAANNNGLSATINLFHANRACPAPRPPNPNVAPNRAAALAAAPSLGAGPGQTPPCQGDRLSEVRQGIRIPCMCPPSQEVFNEQFVLDHGADIRTDGSVQSQQLNLEKAIVTLQNSFCCPAAAVTFNAQLTTLRNGGGAPKAAPAPAPAPAPAQPKQNNNPPPPPPPPPPAANNNGLSATINLFHANRACPAPRPPNPNAAPNRAAALAAAPSLGAGPGQSPPCQGDRLSEVRQGVRIPCMCPPSQDVFNEQFVLDHGADIRTDGSVQSQQLNLEKAIVTLQNSFCCPAAAVTFNAQLTTLRNGGGAPKAAPAPAPAPTQQNNNPPPPPPPPAANNNGLSATINLFHANRACPAPRPPNPNAAPNRAAALAAAPSLGAGPGQTPPCQGDRLSEVRQGVRIPCMCPPSQEVFNEQFVLDHGADIRTDGSVQSRQLNLEKAIVTLQNSFCCPASAVTFNAQLTALRS